MLVIKNLLYLADLVRDAELVSARLSYLHYIECGNRVGWNTCDCQLAVELRAIRTHITNLRSMVPAEVFNHIRK